MNDRLESLWKYYEEHASQARQHENQHERMTAFLVAFAGAMIGFLTTQQNFCVFFVFLAPECYFL